VIYKLIFDCFMFDLCKQTNRHLAPVAAALCRTGTTVHLGQVRYYTTRLNRSLVNLGTYRPRLLRAWFNAGVVFGCVAMVTSMLLLTVTVVNMLSRQPAEEQILVPVVSCSVPVLFVVNMPLTFRWYLNWVLCSCWHWWCISFWFSCVDLVTLTLLRTRINVHH